MSQAIRALLFIVGYGAITAPILLALLSVAMGTPWRHAVREWVRLMLMSVILCTWLAGLVFGLSFA